MMFNLVYLFSLFKVRNSICDDKFFDVLLKVKNEKKFKQKFLLGEVFSVWLLEIYDVKIYKIYFDFICLLYV